MIVEVILMGKNYGLLFTFGIGLFFLIGFILVKIVKDKKKLLYFSTGMAFMVMIGMLLFDLIPEIVELNASWDYIPIWKVVITMIFILLGIGGLKCLDVLLPHHHHHHDHESELEHDEHTSHVGIMTSISLIIHNIIEGMSVFVITCESVMTGLMATVAVGMHNIPLGIEIASNMKEKNRKIGNYVVIILLLLSSFLGALLLYVCGFEVPIVVEVIMISVAIGMILYISIFELLPEMKNYKKERTLYYGIITGIILVVLMILLKQE